MVSEQDKAVLTELQAVVDNAAKNSRDQIRLSAQVGGNATRQCDLSLKFVVVRKSRFKQSTRGAVGLPHKLSSTKNDLVVREADKTVRVELAGQWQAS